MSLLARGRAGLAHRQLPLLLAAFATVISLPGVGQGFALDDYVLRAIGLGRAREVGISGGPADMFTFNSDAPGAALREMDARHAPLSRCPPPSGQPGSVTRVGRHRPGDRMGTPK
jgi:hypothetical protein